MKTITDEQVQALLALGGWELHSYRPSLGTISTGQEITSLRYLHDTCYVEFARGCEGGFGVANYRVAVSDGPNPCTLKVYGTIDIAEQRKKSEGGGTRLVPKEVVMLHLSHRANEHKREDAQREMQRRRESEFRLAEERRESVRSSQLAAQVACWNDALAGTGATVTIYDDAESEAKGIRAHTLTIRFSNGVTIVGTADDHHPTEYRLIAGR